MMKIAYFSDTYHPQPNGVATVLGYIIKNLRERGLKIYLFAPRIKGYKDTEEDIYRLPSTRVLPTLPDSIRLPLPIPHKSYLNIIRLKSDLVHAHGNGIFSFLGLLVARSKKVPYILTFHTQMSHFSHYFLKGRVLKGKHLNDILLKRFGNLCDGITTPSEKMKQELIQAGVKKHIEVIPNFVNFERFKVKNNNFLHKKYNIPKSSPILLSVGRLGKEKNFEFLLQMFKKITEQNHNAYLVIVGEGLGEKELRKLIQELGLKKRVRLTGRIPYENMPYVYKSADLFVFPSVSETHAMVVIEAAASALPLVVARDQAYKGIVVNNVNGYSLPLDKEQFARKIIKLLNEPSLRRKFAEASIKIVQNNFNPDKIIRKLIRYYGQVRRDFKVRPKLLDLSRFKTQFGSI